MEFLHSSSSIPEKEKIFFLLMIFFLKYTYARYFHQFPYLPAVLGSSTSAIGSLKLEILDRAEAFRS